MDHTLHTRYALLDRAYQMWLGPQGHNLDHPWDRNDWQGKPHQQVHQLPVIRKALLEVLSKRYSTHEPWITASSPPESWANSKLTLSIKFKSKLIGLLGAAKLSRLVRQNGFGQNDHLLGVYGFNVSEMRYLQLLRSWLQSAVDGGARMCYPSLAGSWSDPLQEARHKEYRVLSSNAFTALVDRAGLKIALNRPGFGGGSNL